MNPIQFQPKTLAAQPRFGALKNMNDVPNDEVRFYPVIVTSGTEAYGLNGLHAQIWKSLQQNNTEILKAFSKLRDEPFSYQDLQELIPNFKAALNLLKQFQNDPGQE